MSRQQPVFIGLGSNLGDRVHQLRIAAGQLAGIMTITRVSNLYTLVNDGRVSPSAYINAVVFGHTTLRPHDLLNALHDIEERMGRRKGVRYGPQPIDLDLLFYNGVQMNTLELTIPHPLIPQRAFILKPLVEIAPDFMHPTLFYTMRQLLQDAEDAHAVQIYNPEA